MVNLNSHGMQVNEEIDTVAGMLTGAAVRFLPHVQPRGKKRWRDDTLSHLCVQSRALEEHGRRLAAPKKVHYNIMTRKEDSGGQYGRE